MTKHILHIVENSNVPADKRVWSEAVSAKEWGYEVSIICPNRNNKYPKFERIEGIDIYRYPQFLEASKMHLYFFEYINALFFQFLLSCKIFLKKRFNIIHSANPPDNIFLIALFFKFFNVKYIFDHHDLCTSLFKVKFGKEGLTYKLLSFFERWSLRAADVVISTNESLKKIAMVKGKKSESDVYVVRNGPDTKKITIRQAGKDFRNGSRFLVGYVGKISQQESLDNMFRIIQYIVKERGIDDIKFIIIGSGPSLEEFISLSEAMSLSDYIEFTGFVPFEELLGILQQCDIGINPEYSNPYTDKSTMLKIMDYMLVEKPIIQFETTEGHFTAGESSIYIKDNNEIDFANNIIELLNNKAKLEKMGKIGRKRVDSFLNWDIQKKNLKEAYIHLLN